MRQVMLCVVFLRSVARKKMDPWFQSNTAGPEYCRSSRFLRRDGETEAPTIWTAKELSSVKRFVNRL